MSLKENDKWNEELAELEEEVKDYEKQYTQEVNEVTEAIKWHLKIEKDLEKAKVALEKFKNEEF